MTTRTKFAVTFTSACGETREIVVELTEEEQADCALQDRNHGVESWPLLENTYAANRAAEGMPAEFVESFPIVERVVVH